MRRLTGKFQATDSDGRTYTVEAWTNFLDGEVEGSTSLQTSNGSHLNPRGKGEYEMLGTGIILRSTDPNAP